MTTADISHASAEAHDAQARAEVAAAQKRTQREDRRRAQEALHQQIPDTVIARAHLSLDSAGALTQTFSGATVDLSGCGCGKPAAMNARSMTMITSPLGKDPRSDAARALARRVDRASATFASAAPNKPTKTTKTAPVVLFDANGVILGLARDPGRITVPDKQNVAVFDSEGRLLGMIAVKDITAVAAGEPVGRSGSGVAQAPPRQIPVSPSMAAVRQAFGR